MNMKNYYYYFFFASVQEQQQYCRREPQKTHVEFQGQGEFLGLVFLETWEHHMSVRKTSH